MKSYKVLLFIAGLLLPLSSARGQVSFPGPELLGRPETNSVTVNIVAASAIQAYVEYGPNSEPSTGTYPNITSTVSAAANAPIVFTLTSLSPDQEYYYRVVYKSGTSSWTPRAEHSFHTTRSSGDTFTFTITSDSHINIVFGTPSLFQQTLQNIASESPDFHLDLGDTFAMDGVTSQSQANSNYLNLRSYFGLISPSVPIFLALGNHEQEEGWHLSDTSSIANSPPVMSAGARKQYYLNPNPDSFYTGNSDINSSGAAAVSGDHLIEDYYAWTWGDALFVVIDPYWYTPTKPYAGNTGGGEPGYPTAGQPADRWRWTLGVNQYQWLEKALQSSTAKYKFIFAHQVAGGMDDYGRGGANAVPYVEWGGYDTNGTTLDFDSQRTGWDAPVHQLLVKYNVTAFFHGHDHEFAYEKRDGVVYQLVPMAADATYGYGFGDYHVDANDPYTISVLPNSGHLRVTVSPAEVTVDYVRAFLSGAGTNGQIAYTYNIPATSGGSGSATITATAGTPQSATINSAFGTALQATVKDASNNPVSGVSVTFAAPGTGASGTFAGSATVSTNSGGAAVAPAFTANGTTGSYTVTATAAGVNSPASFSLTNNSKPSFIPVRVNSGGTAYADSLGQKWTADTGYAGGSAYSVSNNITNTSDPMLYKTSRYGTSFSYSFAAPAGTYSVTLKFAEPVWSAKGKRLFNVAINGTTVLSKFDIFAAAAGEFKAVDETFKVTSTGTIKIQFTQGSAGNPLVNAIQLVTSP